VICRDVGGSYTCQVQIMGGSYGDNARAFDGAFYRVFEEKGRGLRGEGQGSSSNSIEVRLC
ncbi:hypothetical protein Tco_1358923, partial [Tanacetum coccineum]